MVLFIPITDCLIKIAELKPSNEKTSSVDTKDGLTSGEIRMNIEKLKKRGAPKAPKVPSSRFVNLLVVVFVLFCFVFFEAV